MSSKRLSPKSTGSCVRGNNRFEWRMRNLMSPCGMSQNFTEQVCRVNLYQSRQDVRSLPPKGVDRRRLRCRYHAVGCAASRDDPTGESASWLRLHAVGGLRGYRMAGDDDRQGRGCCM